WSSVQPSRSSAHRSMGAANVEGALLDSPGRPHWPSIPLPGLRNLWDRELHPPPNSGRCHGCVSCAPTARWWPGIICWRSCQWVPRDGGCSEPCASRREGVDHFVHPRHPPHKGRVLSSQTHLISFSPCVTLSGVWPRFRHEAAAWEGSLIQQRHEDGEPALAKDTDQA